MLIRLRAAPLRRCHSPTARRLEPRHGQDLLKDTTELLTTYMAMIGLVLPIATFPPALHHLRSRPICHPICCTWEPLVLRFRSIQGAAAGGATGALTADATVIVGGALAQGSATLVAAGALAATAFQLSPAMRPHWHPLEP